MKKIIEWIDTQVMRAEGYLTDRMEKLKQAEEAAEKMRGDIIELEEEIKGLRRARGKLEG